MDDFVILSNDKKELQVILRDIESFLYTELDLLLNPKTAMLNAKNGVDFCGFRHYKDHKKIRRRSVKNMRKTIRAYHKGKISKERFSKSLTSWLAHVSHADTFNLQKRILWVNPEPYLTGEKSMRAVEPVKTIDQPNQTVTLGTGNIVSIQEGALYGGLSTARGKPVPASQFGGKRHTVSAVAIHYGEREALLKEINSWVAIKYLVCVV